MKFPTQPGRFLMVAALAAVACPLGARADINGFGDFSGFSVNINDSASAPTVLPGVIHLITSGLGARSVIDKTPQNISQFTASFTWQPGANLTGGATFLLENVAAGAGNGTSPVGTGASNLGYGNGNGDFGGSNGKSAVVTLEAFSAISGATGSGLYFNGLIPGGSNPTSPVNLRSTDPINVTLTYDGSTLHETLFDTVALTTYGTSYLVNLTSKLGASTAYVGVTAGGESQTFSNFQFTSGAVPEPASLGLLATCGIPLILRRRRR